MRAELVQDPRLGSVVLDTQEWVNRMQKKYCVRRTSNTCPSLHVTYPVPGARCHSRDPQTTHALRGAILSAGLVAGGIHDFGVPTPMRRSRMARGRPWLKTRRPSVTRKTLDVMWVAGPPTEVFHIGAREPVYTKRSGKRPVRMMVFARVEPSPSRPQ